MVDEAHQLGLPVAAHAHGTSSIRAAVDAGVDTIEHGSWLSGPGLFEPDEQIARDIVAVQRDVAQRGRAGRLGVGKPPERTADANSQLIRISRTPEVQRARALPILSVARPPLRIWLRADTRQSAPR